MNQESLNGWRLARQVVSVQALITGLAAVLAYHAHGAGAGAAAVWGGLTAIVPTLYFAWRLFQRHAYESPEDVVGGAFRGEIGKIVLTALMFFWGVVLFTEHYAVLLVSFMACTVAYWVVSFRDARRRS